MLTDAPWESARGEGGIGMVANAWREPRHTGQGIWVGAKVAAAVAAVMFVMVATGCAKRAQVPGAPTTDEWGAIGEKKVPGGSSLDRARRGLAPEEDGVLADVHFDYDSYDLGSDARATLARNAEWLKANERATLEIEGHTDERGTIEYNLALGARRAKAVKDYLAVLGVGAERMATISYGEELPVCRETGEDCWRRNRRAHFVILSP